MNSNSLLRIADLTKEELMNILCDAQAFENEHQDWQLPKHKLVANLFFENSTRTHYSFASAEHQLGCAVSDFSAVTSSIQKGESLYDTVKTFQAIGYDALVIRHPQNEYFRELESIDIPILNGGDGSGNHPTQCLLDLLTIYQEFGKFEGLNVVIVGDIQHSRVANSNKEALDMLGAHTKFSGPLFWNKQDENYMDFDEAIEWADAVMLLRIQHERHEQHLQMSQKEYLEKYGLTKNREKKMKEHAIIMHPAPVNRGAEIDTDLVECSRSRIFKQMSNGVLVRKAVIKRAFGVEF